MILTKYFGDDAKDFILAGSFKFGSLQSYNKQETQSNYSGARFDDEKEGKLKIDVERLTSIGKNPVSTVGFEAHPKDSNSQIFISDCTIPFTLTAYVFSSSMHGYDECHHRAMVEGIDYKDGTKYEGNPELLNYALIDLKKFERALDLLHPQNAPPAANIQPISVDCAPVLYGEKDFSVNTVTKGFRYSKFSASVRTAFMKPEIFRIEKEFRHVLRRFSSENIRYSQESAIISSPTLADAILDVGRI